MKLWKVDICVLVAMIWLSIGNVQAALTLVMPDTINQGNYSAAPFSGSCPAPLARGPALSGAVVGMDFWWTSDDISAPNSTWHKIDEVNFGCTDIWSLTGDFSAVSGRAKWLKARVWEIANTTNIIDSAIVMDLSPPNLTVVAPKLSPGKFTVDSSTAATFNLQVNADEALASMTVSITGVTETVVMQATDPKIWAGGVSKAGLPDGASAITFVATDLSGNTATSGPHSVVFNNAYMNVRLVDDKSQLDCKAMRISKAETVGDDYYVVDDLLCYPKVKGIAGTGLEGDFKLVNGSDPTDIKYCKFGMLRVDANGLPTLTAETNSDCLVDLCGSTQVGGAWNINNTTYNSSSDFPLGGALGVRCENPGGTIAAENVALVNADVCYEADTVYLGPGFSASAPDGNHTFKIGSAACSTAARTVTKQASVNVSTRVGKPSVVTEAVVPSAQPLGWADLPMNLREQLIAAKAKVADMFADAEGKYIVFTTDVPLVQQDGNVLLDVYLYDAYAERLILVSTGAAGKAANGSSDQARIDGSGTLVVFRSEAANLAVDDDNGVSDVFVYNIESTVIERIGATTSPSGNPVVATSPRRIYFDQGLESQRDVYSFDFDWPSLELARIPHLAGELEGGESHHPGVSADARFLVYLSTDSGADNGCSVHYLNTTNGDERTLSCPQELSSVVEYAPFFEEDAAAVIWLPRVEMDNVDNEAWQPIRQKNPLY